MACLVLTGCSTVQATKPPLINSARLPSFNYTSPRTANYYLTLYNSAAPADKARVRNAILSDLMAVIDLNYHEFEARLRTDKAVKDTAAEIATLGLTAASAAVGGEEVKTILSAVATGVVGANSVLDKNILQNNTIEALELEMRSLRAQKERDLLNGMAESDAHYPLQSGIRDIIAYYYAGSLTDAMLGLVERTGSDAQANLASTAEVRKALQGPR
ncbi:MAG TPA: hypothetical protein VMJ12_15635 [Candidatus Acidoferrales bacterium]|nr:hypothetical protein [Candidatus Acidoferrales bacterium]